MNTLWSEVPTWKPLRTTWGRAPWARVGRSPLACAGQRRERIAELGAHPVARARRRRDLQVGVGRGLEAGPRGGARAVGVAGRGEAQPIPLHRLGHGEV